MSAGVDQLAALGDAVGSEPVVMGDSQLTKCLQSSTDAPVVREFALSQASRYRRLLSALVATLNAEDAAVKKKTTALVCLANFGKQKPARSELFDAVKRLDMQFEKTLGEKERAHEAFGSALGKLHETTVILLMRMDGYKLSGGELLEFAGGGMPFAVDLLLGILKVPTYEGELVANCCSCLCDLSDPSTYITMDEGMPEDLFRGFRDKVDALITCVMRKNVVAEACAALLRPLSAAARGDGGPQAPPLFAHAALQRLSRAVLNLYAFSSQGGSSVALRQSILVATDIGRRAVPLYMSTCFAQIEKCLDLQAGELLHPVPVVAIAGAANALRLLSFASFHMGQHCVLLRQLNTWTVWLLRLPLAAFVEANLSLYAVLLHSNVNIDALAGELSLPKEAEVDEVCRSATILHALSQLVAGLPRPALEQLWGLLGRSSAQTPLARDNISFDILSNMFDAALKRDRIDDAELDAVVSDLDRHIGGLERERDDLSALREELRQLPRGRPRPELSEQVDLSQLPALTREPSHGANNGAPPAAPQEPVQVNPLVEPRRPSRMAPSMEQAWRAAPARPLSAAGDRAALGASSEPVPKEFQCAINGHLLKQPVRAPSGNVYERDTIETWLRQTGSCDPLTGDPLTAEQLVPDDELMSRIVVWQINATLTVNRDKAAGDDDDMYDF